MTPERLTLDTSLLIYGLDTRDPHRQAIARQILRAATTRDCILTNQALAETFNAARRKLGMPPGDAARVVRDLMILFPSVAASRQAVETALREAEAGRFSFWDALLLAAAAEAGCTVALSEDMHPGSTLDGLTVCSAFGPDGPSAVARRLLGIGDDPSPGPAKVAS